MFSPPFLKQVSDVILVGKLQSGIEQGEMTMTNLHSGSEWNNGEAVAYALSLDFFQKPMAAWLLSLGLRPLALFGLATWYWEAFAPFLFVSPVKSRTICFVKCPPSLHQQALPCPSSNDPSFSYYDWCSIHSHVMIVMFSIFPSIPEAFQSYLQHLMIHG
jgi:hypothetical protein